MAVCDLVEKQREWFRQVPTVRLITADYHELLASAEVDVVYVAVPHNLHETIYLEVLKAGKDLLAEKPFGIDLEAARAIAATAQSSGRFVRCSSEFPFFPGAQRAFRAAKRGLWVSCSRSILVSTTAAISIPTSLSIGSARSRPVARSGSWAILACMQSIFLPSRLESVPRLRPAAENLSRAPGRQRRNGSLRHMGQCPFAHRCENRRR